MGKGSRQEESIGDYLKRAVLVMLALGLFLFVLWSPIGHGLIRLFSDWYLGLIVR